MIIPPGLTETFGEEKTIVLMNLRDELVEILIYRHCASHYTFTSGNSLSILRCCFCLTSYYHNSLSLLDNKNL